MTFALLTERRRVAPPGAEGGRPGLPGRNLVVREGQEAEELPSKAEGAAASGRPAAPGDPRRRRSRAGEPLTRCRSCSYTCPGSLLIRRSALGTFEISAYNGPQVAVFSACGGLWTPRSQGESSSPGTVSVRPDPHPNLCQLLSKNGPLLCVRSPKASNCSRFARAGSERTTSISSSSTSASSSTPPSITNVTTWSDSPTTPSSGGRWRRACGRTASRRPRRCSRTAASSSRTGCASGPGPRSTSTTRWPTRGSSTRSARSTSGRRTTPSSGCAGSRATRCTCSCCGSTGSSGP